MLFDCVLGNSSSGIIEAPIIGIKVLNIGDRQKGRFRFGKVIDVNNDRKSIQKKVQEIILLNTNSKENDLNLKRDFSKLISPSKLILDILRQIDKP